MKNMIKNTMILIFATCAIMTIAFGILCLTAKPAYAATINIKAGQVKNIRAPKNAKITSKNKKVVITTANKKMIALKTGRTQIVIKKNKKVVNKINVRVIDNKRSDVCEPGCHKYELKHETVIDRPGYTKEMTTSEFEKLSGKTLDLDQETITVTYPEQSHRESHLICAKCGDIKK